LTVAVVLRERHDVCNAVHKRAVDLSSQLDVIKRRWEKEEARRPRLGDG